MAALTVEFPQTVWTVEFGGDEIVVAPVTMAPGAPGGGGGGAVDSVNGATGTVVLDAGDVGADPAGTAAGLVDDLSGVTNAAAARSNLGLGALATLSAVSSAEIVDGTIVNADVGAGAAIALSKLAVDPLARANHTGTQAQSTVTNLVSDLAGKAAVVHSHAAADITSGVLPIGRLATGTPDGTKFVRDDGTLATPPGVGSIGSQRVLGRVSAGSGAVEELTGVQVRALAGLAGFGPPSGAWVPIHSFVGVTGSASALGTNTTQSDGLAIWQWWPTAASLTIDRVRFFLNTANGGASAVATFAVYAADGVNGGPGTPIAAGSAAINGAAGEKEITMTTTLPAPGFWWALIPRNLDTAGVNPQFWAAPRPATGLWGTAPSGNTRRPQMISPAQTGSIANPAVSSNAVFGATTDCPTVSVRLV